MTWDSKYPAFGVIKIQGDKIHLYSSRDNYHTLTIGKPIISTVWAGNYLKLLWEMERFGDTVQETVIAQFNC